MSLRNILADSFYVAHQSPILHVQCPGPISLPFGRSTKVEEIDLEQRSNVYFARAEQLKAQWLVCVHNYREAQVHAIGNPTCRQKQIPIGTPQTRLATGPIINRSTVKTKDDRRNLTS